MSLSVCPSSPVFVTLSCIFRYGRDDMDVMGIAFRRELYLSTRQVYPPLQDRERGIHTKTQAKLLRKLGDNAYPFFFEVRGHRRVDWSRAAQSSLLMREEIRQRNTARTRLLSWTWSLTQVKLHCQQSNMYKSEDCRWNVFVSRVLGFWCFKIS